VLPSVDDSKLKFVLKTLWPNKDTLTISPLVTVLKKRYTVDSKWLPFWRSDTNVWPFPSVCVHWSLPLGCGAEEGIHRWLPVVAVLEKGYERVTFPHWVCPLTHHLLWLSCWRRDTQWTISVCRALEGIQMCDLSFPTHCVHWSIPLSCPAKEGIYSWLSVFVVLNKGYERVAFFFCVCPLKPSPGLPCWRRIHRELPAPWVTCWRRDTANVWPSTTERVHWSMSLHAPAMGGEGRGSSSNLSERSGSRDRDRTDMSTFRAIALLAVDDSEPSEYAFNCEYSFTHSVIHVVHILRTKSQGPYGKHTQTPKR
jgi:hypothetical protein